MQLGDSNTYDLHLKQIFQLGLMIISNNLFHQLLFAFSALLHAKCSLGSLLLLFLELTEF